jgi:hypothetical protein
VKLHRALQRLQTYLWTLKRNFMPCGNN